MNKLISISCILFSSLMNCLHPVNCDAQNNKLHEYVNPFIGTGGHGHTFPGPTMPFGACQVGPDTRLSGWDGCSGYHYSDSIIYGFSHTHLSGTGCSDYGDILLMPVSKETAVNDYQYKSKFSHQHETAKAGYYQVYLDDNKVNVELTTTLHGAIHKYTYPASDNMFVVLDLKHRDEVLDSKMIQIDDYTLEGYRFSKAWASNQKVFYRINFSKKIESIQYEAVKSASQTSMTSFDKSLHCIIKFEKDDLLKLKKAGNIVNVKVTISGVDEQGAEKNMLAEMPHWDFEKYRQQAETIWEMELGKIKIPLEQDDNSPINTMKNQSNIGSFANQQIIFYTALYHSMIHPSIYNDVDGRYRGRDDKIHNTEGKFDYYTVFSLWDTYRALHPLLTIIDKKRSNDFVNTFIQQYLEGGRLPIWELSSNETNCMIAYHVVSVIWDTYNKGIRNYDANKAYEAMTKIATHYTDYEGVGLNLKMKEQARNRCADADALESYCKFGYVRSDDSHESVSKTLEFAYDDWCIAQMANALGKTKDYDYYLSRSNNWLNVYDPTSGFMRARKNGALYQPFSPYTVDNNFTEANSWQYSFYVPHHMDELIAVSGGRQAFKKKLDDLFSAKEKTEGREQADITGLIGQYAHGNEPSHQMAYLYNYAANENLTSSKINFIRNNFYKNEPDGLIGNEDCGQMSAWYVLSAIGLYPVCPGNNLFNITEPAFDSILLLNKIKLVYRHPKNQKASTFITINHANKIAFDALLNQQTKYFIANNTSNEKPKKLALGVGISNPYIENAGRIFKDSLKVQMGCLPKQFIYYTLNKQKEQQYMKPFTITKNSDISFYTVLNGTSLRSSLQTATFTSLPNDRKVILKSVYNKSYSAGGAEAMMDGLYGKINWRAGDWQGYQGQDVEIIISFEKSREIKRLAANFLEDQNSWIFYPKEVTFYTSDDLTKWTLIESIPTNKSDHQEKVSIDKFQTTMSHIPKAKYVKMIAKNFGPMPQWHEGRGNETFIFIDEFEVN